MVSENLLRDFVVCVFIVIFAVENNRKTHEYNEEVFIITVDNIDC